MSIIPDIEKQSIAEIKRFQEIKLIELLLYIKKYSRFYQNHFAKYGIDIYGILTLEDLLKIPPTTKNDLQEYNWDFLCVKKSAVTEYTSTSGTLGRPVTIALSTKDLDRLAYNESISFSCADGTSDDLYHLMLTLDRQFMAGMAYYEGIKRLGGSIVRVGPGVPAMQWNVIQKLRPTVIVGVPSFLLKLIQHAEESGIRLNTSSVKKAVCIGESIRTPTFELNALGSAIKAKWDIQLYSTYASTEMQTAFTECTYGKGGHHHPELIILELLDENNNPVKEGTPGEVTITTLGVEAMPLLRFKTGDIATHYTEPCVCGRNTIRVGPVIGRRQQMIKLKGTTVYPPAIVEIINSVPAVKDYVIEAFYNEMNTDELRLHLVVNQADQQDVYKALHTLFQSWLRVVPAIVFSDQLHLEQLQLGEGNRKLKKFIDRRVSCTE